jgi:hypothetical protein
MRPLRAWLVVGAASLVACTGTITLEGGAGIDASGGHDDVDANLPPGTPDADLPPGIPDADVPPGTPDADLPPVTADAAPAGSCDDISGTREQQVCLHWKCDRAVLDEGTWTGDVGSCNAGDVTNGGRDNALRLLNMYRFIAQLPPVTHENGRNMRAQKCALMMDANDSLSHAPPMSWTCYSADGASGAGSSNIASAPGVTAIDMYMNDFGNATTMGHRRWLLSNSLGPVGLGSTSQSSCAQVIGGNGHAGKPWMAWPPVGPVPLAAFKAGGFGQSIDETGWTIQSDSIDLDPGQVTVTDGGTNRPVTTTVLGAGYGSSSAIRFVPSGWTAAAGHTYHVSVAGVSTAIAYDVQVVACP